MKTQQVPSWMGWGVGGALIMGLALRVLWALLVPVDPVSDSAIYDEFARSMAGGSGFAFADGKLTAFWAVGTSALYSVFYRVFGPGFGSIVALNVALGVGMIWLTFALTARHASHRAGVIAAWLVACWPALIQFTTVLASELLFGVLLLATLWVWGKTSWPTHRRGAVWAALLCAAVYVRPTASPLFVLLPALQWWKDRDTRSALITLLVAAMTAAALFAPWVWRNQQVFGSFVLVSTNFGPNFWMGNNPKSDGGYMPMPETGLTNEVDVEKHLKQEALQFIRQNPGAYMKLCAKRFVTTYGRESIGISWNEKGLVKTWGTGVLWPIKLLSNLYWWAALMACMVAAVAATFRRQVNLVHPLVAVAGLFFIVPVLTVGQDRYHLPLNPFMAMLVATAIAHWLREVSHPSPPAAALHTVWKAKSS